VLLLLIASSPSIKATNRCNSFPKIFGGSNEETFLRQIDVFNDFLAIAGNTWDNSLTGITSSIPFVVLQSISVCGKIYWAKAFSLKT
jgi:hypothetical protein